MVCDVFKNNKKKDKSNLKIKETKILFGSPLRASLWAKKNSF